MTHRRPRSRSILLALTVAGALALPAGAAFAFATMPDAAAPGLDRATNAAGHAVPARPADAATLPEDEAAPAPADAADLPDAAAHGAAVSAVATGEDPTPDTNRGADVSAVARDNHGQSVAAGHRPENAGKPDGAGQPEEPGQPDEPGRP